MKKGISTYKSIYNMIYCKYTHENVHKIRVLDLLQNKSWEIEGGCLGTFTNILKDWGHKENKGYATF